jgi:hypothetical protein
MIDRRTFTHFFWKLCVLHYFCIDSTMSKRTRTETGWSSKAKIAAAINARTNARFPYSQYGRSYSKRGVAGSPAMLAYGDSWKSATKAQRANRKEYGYYGRGLYSGRGGFWSDFKKGFGDVVGAAGKAVKAVEGLTGKGLYTGRGIYDSNVLVNGPHLDPRPALHFSGTGDETSTLIMSQKEYIGDVFAPDSTNFTNTSYDLNPGLVANFPFLAQYAQNFEEYEFEQLVFEYHSTVDASSTNNPNGNTGTVIMATNYNVSSPAFTDKEQMIQYHGGVSGRMTDNLTHGVECEPSKNAGSPQKYVRTFIPVNQDLKSYDLGKFQIAFQNIPQSYFNQQVGELWVYYKVKLTKPRLFSAQSGNVQIYRAISNFVTPPADSTGGAVTFSDAMPGPLNNPASNIPAYLTALGNSLDCKLEHAQLTNANGDVAWGAKIIFPAQTNGTFEVTVRYRGLNDPTTGILEASALNPVTTKKNEANMTTAFGGNVTPWADLYGAVVNNPDAEGGVGNNSTNISKPVATPTWNQVYHHAPFTSADAGQSGQAGSAILIAHVNVKSATAGIDNTLEMCYFYNFTILSGWEVTVREISPFLATSASIQAPLFQNEQGTVTIPPLGPTSYESP